MSEIFFIIGCPRSATTAYARILNTASNAEVYVEQAPKLRRASRELIKGNLADPEVVLLEARQSAILETLSKGLKYGDKNPCYLPFLPHIFRLWNCKVILLTRDPRAVIRSMLDCYHLRPVNVFSMYEDDGVSGARRPEDDPWDYSRLRPNPDEPMFDCWGKISRFEKCAWYWANFNERALNAFSKVSEERWRVIDVTFSTVEVFKEVFQFVGLTGFDRDEVGRLLASRINSLEELTGSCNIFPEYEKWTKEQKEILARHAGPVMERLGYKL